MADHKVETKSGALVLDTFQATVTRGTKPKPPLWKRINWLGWASLVVNVARLILERMQRTGHRVLAAVRRRHTAAAP